MSRNGAGSYTLPAPYPSGFANGTTIDAPTMNTVFTDIQTAMTASTAADGQTPIAGNWDWKGYTLTGVSTLSATAAAFTNVSTSGGVTVGNGFVVTKGGATVTAGGLTVTAGGLTVTAGGATITAGGVTVAAGGAAVTGNSTVTGTMTVSDALTVSKGGAAITGNSTVTGTLTVASTIGAAAGTKAGLAVIFDQFPATLASPGGITLPSGLILKWGTGTYTAGTGTVTFAVNFPTALLNVQCTLTTGGAAHASWPPGPSPASYAVSGFTVYGGTGQNGTFSWLALGH
jgi:hypothetical protein